MRWYDTRRVQEQLKGMTRMEYREHALQREHAEDLASPTFGDKFTLRRGVCSAFGVQSQLSFENSSTVGSIELWVADLVWEVYVTSVDLPLDQPENQTADQASDWPGPFPAGEVDHDHLAGLGKAGEGD